MKRIKNFFDDNKESVREDKIILEPIIPLTELGGSLKKIGEGKTKNQLIKEIKSGWEKNEKMSRSHFFNIENTKK